MQTVQDHTELEGTHILEAVKQANESDIEPTNGMLVGVLVPSGEPTSGSPAYKYVRRLTGKLVQNGLLEQSKDGRQYIFELTSDGRDVIGSNEVEVSENGQADDTTDDEPEAEEEANEANEAEEEEETESSGVLDEVLADADDEYTEEITEEDLNDNASGRERLPEEKREEMMEAPTHFPDNGETREIKRFLTRGANCKGSSIVVAEDAVEAGFIDSMDEAGSSVARIACPHCGRSAGLNVMKDGTAKIYTHKKATGTPRPRSPRYVWQEDEETWSLEDPNA